MRFRTIITLLIFALSTSIFGKTEDQRKAQELGTKAIKQMDAGNISGAIELLEESTALDPESIFYPYEIAYAHYLNKEYKVAIDLFNELIKHPQCIDRIYQMLGNAYDMNNDLEKAITVYDLGLHKFPASGILNLERGGIEYVKGNDQVALEYYEKGIQVAPQFPSNYYWASKLYLSSTEKVWGMLYGEIFMNLERGSKRTSEISKLLYDTYKSQIKFTSEGSRSIDFSRSSTITIKPGADPGKFKLPFEIGVYEPLLAFSIAGEKSINLDALHRIRARFLASYYTRDFQKDYPNILFDYQREIKNSGHLEAYNHWLLMKGDDGAFKKWIRGNNEAFKKFATWFGKNPIEIDSENKFHRRQYN
ncbi:MAG: tetratricopeptide repeat protein [Pontiella sp.]